MDCTGWFGMSEERLVAEIDGDLKQLVKSDPRTIKDIVESSLQREFQTTENAAIMRRIDEQRQRITTLEREINDREAELSKAKDELERLESVLETSQEKTDTKRQDAIEALSNLPPRKLTTDNAAVDHWATELAMSKESVVELVESNNE